MVQRFANSVDPMDAKQVNSSLTWQGVHFPQTSDRSMGKIGDVLRQLSGDIKVPSLSFQQRRTFEADAQDLPNNKRARHYESDISFRSHGVDPSGLISPSNTPIYEGNRPMHMLARTITLSTSHPMIHPFEEPSPLGLTLKKTPSFLDLVAMTVGQGGNNGDYLLTNGSPSNRAGSTSCPNQGKLKASNFPASTLKIGNWERVSKYEGDVVAKCYYAKRKLVWEVLENGLKSKIELQWSDISAIRANYGEGEIGILEVEVSRPPLFFKETNPQPRKHTLWEATSDFTGGEATICKKHALQFPEGVLNKHYEKLLQCDPRLNSLAGNVEKREGSLEPRKMQPMPMSKVKIEMPYSPLDSRCSPSSAMESRGSEESDGEDSTQDSRLCTTSSSSVVPDNSSTSQDQIQPCNLYFLAGDLSHTKDALNNLAQMLLGETNVSSSPERAPSLIRVSSKTELFNSDDGGSSWMPTSYAVSDWSFAGHGTEDYCPEITTMTTMFQNGEQHEESSDQQQDFFLDDEKPFFRQQNHHGSTGDLLMNLPRIASLPQFFENGLVRRDSHVSLVELL